MYSFSSSAMGCEVKVTSFQISGFLRYVSNYRYTSYLVHARNREPEGIESMAEFAVQWPCYALIQGLDRCVCLLGHVSHDRVDVLALVVALLTFSDILGRHSALRKIDIS